MKKLLSKKSKNQKGFTLVEMIVVIAIIGVLAAMMVPSLMGYIDKANTSNNLAAATNIGRTAQVILAEINDSDLAGSVTAEMNVSNAVEIKDFVGGLKSGTDTMATTDSTPSEFKKKFERMFDTTFKGSFYLNIAEGKNVKVLYSSKDKWPTSMDSEAKVETQLNKGNNEEYGVYPE